MPLINLTVSSTLSVDKECRLSRAGKHEILTLCITSRGLLKCCNLWPRGTLAEHVDVCKSAVATPVRTLRVRLGKLVMQS